LIFKKVPAKYFVFGNILQGPKTTTTKKIQGLKPERGMFAGAKTIF